MDQGYCGDCGQNVKAEKSVNWVLILCNIGLCVITAGIWSIVFFILLFTGAFTSYRCNPCGSNISPARKDVAKITPPNGACIACDERVELVKSTKRSSLLRLLTTPKWYWQVLLTIITFGVWLGVVALRIILALFGTGYVCKHCMGKVDGIRDIP